MKTHAIKKEYKDLDIESLKKVKSKIALFLFDHPNIKRNEQGIITLEVLSNLIEAYKRKDKFEISLLKELFFK